MTTLDDTRYCPMCEDAAKKILELEQRVKVLTDAANCLLKTHAASIFMQGRQIGKGEYAEALKQLQGAVNASPQQTAAQIERGHVEWMMKLEPVGWKDTLRTDHSTGGIELEPMLLGYEGFEKLADATDLYVIPPLPKESKE